MQEKEALKLERARQRRLGRQRQEDQENTTLNDAISHLTTNGENHVNHYDPPETQKGQANTSVLYKIGLGGWGKEETKRGKSSSLPNSSSYDLHMWFQVCGGTIHTEVVYVLE